MTGDRYNSKACYVHDGILRCGICHLPVSQCHCDMLDVDDDQLEDAFGRVPTRHNHFPWNDVTEGAEFQNVHKHGYHAICQHLAELTEVLDRIANRRSS